MVWIQTGDDNRILAVSHVEPEPQDADLWQEVDLDVDSLEHGFDDYLWVDGQLVESPREGGEWWAELHEGERPYTAAEALAALVRSEPSLVEALPDEHLAHMGEYLTQWEQGGAYKRGDVVGYDSLSWRCLMDHTATDPAWNPEQAPSLWAKVLVPDPSVIPDWEQPGSTNPYMRGDKVKHNGKVWESLIDANVWEPGAIGTETLWREVA